MFINASAWRAQDALFASSAFNFTVMDAKRHLDVELVVHI